MTLLTFIIPIQHTDNIKDKQAHLINLSQTILSIENQIYEDWKAVIVINQGTQIPLVSERFSVKYVDFNKNEFYDKSKCDDLDIFRDAVKLDKGNRVLAGIKHAGDSKYFMVVDDDDLICSSLTQYVYENNGCIGWVIKYGYIWNNRSKFLYEIDEFNKFCGTSIILRSDMYEFLIGNNNVSIEYIKNFLGSHINIINILKEKGIELRYIPFRGALYRVGHNGSHSKNGKVISHFVKLKFLKNPLLLLFEISKIKLLTGKVKKNFFNGAKIKD